MSRGPSLSGRVTTTISIQYQIRVPIIRFMRGRGIRTETRERSHSRAPGRPPRRTLLAVARGKSRGGHQECVLGILRISGNSSFIPVSHSSMPSHATSSWRFHNRHSLLHREEGLRATVTVERGVGTANWGMKMEHCSFFICQSSTTHDRAEVSARI